MRGAAQGTYGKQANVLRQQALCAGPHAVKRRRRVGAQRLAARKPEGAGVNDIHAAVDVRVVEAGNGVARGAAHQVVLNCANLTEVLDVSVRLRCQGHVLCAHCEPLAVLRLVADGDEEGDDGRVAAKQPHHQVQAQVRPLHYGRLSARQEVGKKRLQLRQHQLALRLVALH